MDPAHLEQINAALAHHQAGRLALAEEIYRSVLAQDPNNFNALHLLGIVLHQRGENEASRQLIEQAVAMQPRVAEMRNSLGNTLLALNRFADAEAQYAEAAQLKPESPDAHYNRGNALQAMGDLPRAIVCFQRAIQLNPHLIGAYNNLGSALAATGKFDAAIALLRRAIEIQPDFAQAWNTLGNVLLTLGRPDEAEAAFARAIGVSPSFMQAHNNRSIALLTLGRLAESEAAAARAIELAPAFADAHSNHGGALLAQGLIEPAVEAFRRTVQLNPKHHHAHSNLLVAMHYSETYSPAEIFQEHLRWASQHAPPPLPSIAREPLQGRRLRVGYLSPNFAQHAVGFFIDPLLANHDRSQFEIFCYSDVAVPDPMTTRLKTHAEHWRHTAAIPDAQLAELIRDDRIDILIDLAGHTANNRMPLMSLKPAPLQGTYLGYPDTTGLAAVGFRITDALADPPGLTESLHTERLVRLPRTAWCYWPIEDAPAVAPPPRDVSGVVTFGSFNNLAKITPRMIELWSTLLHATDNSRLLIKARGLQDAAVQRRLRDLFTTYGISGQVELHPPTTNLGQHLAVYHRVDIALDTFPYQGTTTTCEALYMGVPVVTLAGQTHVSRVGVSLLTSTGLPHLIANSAAEYIRIAAGLCNDKAMNRLELRERLRASPLLDAAAFARDFECWLQELSNHQP